MTFLLISHQATLVLEKHRFAHRPLTSEESRNVVVLLRRQTLVYSSIISNKQKKPHTGFEKKIIIVSF